MDFKPIQKIISQTTDLQTDQPASPTQLNTAGISDVSDAVEIANAAQQELFSADFQTFDLQKHYSGVHMQQGRVQTDEDWNEQKDSRPSLEDGIVVQFQNGETRSPFITGDLWDFTERPPEEQTKTSDDSSDPKRKP